jgi:predicted Zn-dependent peptidase
MKVMRKISALFVALAIVGMAGLSHANADFLAKYENKKLPRIKPPNVTMRVLANGLRIYLLEDHTLPIIKIGAILRTGSIYDPPDKVGLAILSGDLLRSGGAGEMSPQSFDKALDDLGAQMNAGIGQEMGTAGLEVLADDMEQGLQLLFEMLFKPRFDQERLAVAKQNLLEELRRQDDDPQTLASYTFRQLLYGKHSPWSRRPTDASIGRISRDDIAKLHARYFKTNNLIITAAGDFKEKDLIRAVQAFTAQAPQGEISFPEVAPVERTFADKTEDIPRKLSQAFIRMGHLSIKRHNPDKYALFLVDDVLGASGFMSRLVSDVRARRGMAYSIWSQLSLGTDYGTFEIGVNTKASNAGKVIELVKQHLKRMAIDGDITEDELHLARQTILARLIFQFDSPFNIVTQQARLYFFDYPDDYWRVYRDRIAHTDLHQVKAAAKKYLRPDALDIVVVGPSDITGKGR